MWNWYVCCLWKRSSSKESFCVYSGFSFLFRRLKVCQYPAHCKLFRTLRRMRLWERKVTCNRQIKTFQTMKQLSKVSESFFCTNSIETQPQPREGQWRKCAYVCSAFCLLDLKYLFRILLLNKSHFDRCKQKLSSAGGWVKMGSDPNPCEGVTRRTLYEQSCCYKANFRTRSICLVCLLRARRAARPVLMETMMHAVATVAIYSSTCCLQKSWATILKKTSRKQTSRRAMLRLQSLQSVGVRIVLLSKQPFHQTLPERHRPGREENNQLQGIGKIHFETT